MNREDKYYDINQYTDAELYDILDLVNPTDRVLEAKIIQMINKYNLINNESGRNLTDFFRNIYQHFFLVEEEDEEEEQEGFANLENRFESLGENTMGNVYEKMNANLSTLGGTIQANTMDNVYEKMNANLSTLGGTIQANTMGNVYEKKNQNLSENSSFNENRLFSQTNPLYKNKSLNMINSEMQQKAQQPITPNPNNDKILSGPPVNSEANITAVNQLDYTKDTLNPLLKQTVKRIISIDSQYRDSTMYPLSTEFTFNLSEPLKDVLALRLYSVQIPYTWYTINKNYGGNFFYLKGNAPGIDNGNFDYKIEIESGNYDPSSLVDTVNQSLQSLKTLYTDVSFGTTEIYYTNASSLARLKVDITNIFNETDYTLSFYSEDPTLNYYPTKYPTVSSQTTQVEEMRYLTESQITSYNASLSSLSAFLGFNDLSYSANCITSRRTLPPTNQYNLEDNNPIYWIDGSNNYFNIIQYQGSVNSSGRVTNTPNKELQTITIRLSLKDGYQTRNTILQDLNNQLQLHSSLINSNIERIDIEPFKENAGFSFFRMTVNLSKKTTTNIINEKTRIEFPTETREPFLWVSNTLNTNSCFQFPTTTMELNILQGESRVIQSNYDINQNTYFVLKCKAEGYQINDICLNGIHIDYSGNYSDISNNIVEGKLLQNTSSRKYYTDPSYNYWNDYKVTLDRKIYSLTGYFDAINKGITTTNTYSIVTTSNPIGVFNTDSMKIYPDSSNKINFRFDLNKYFTEKNYTLDFSGTLLKTTGLDFTRDLVDRENMSNISNFDLSGGVVSIKKRITAPFYFSYNITTDDNLILKIKPNGTGTNAFAKDWEVRYNGSNSYLNIDEYVNIINNTFLNFTDAPNSYPLQGMKIALTHKPDNSIELEFIIKITKTLTQNDYEVYFYDASNNANQDISSSWKTILGFDASYSLYNMSNTSYTDISSSTANESFSYYLPKDTYLYLNPITSGLTTSNQLNDNISPIVITIPAAPSRTKNTYTLNDIFVIINQQFAMNEETKGSYIDMIQSTNSTNYVTIYLTINKIYTEKDYKVVFYDFTSFVKCYVGNKTAKNVTWDTTLGWILGFHMNTEYILKDYYKFFSSNITINGDTTITTNLYNYFLITIDDYIQNHLNDGLVTLTPAENFATLPSYATRNHFQCSPQGDESIFTGTLSDLPGKKLTQNQIYSANQIHMAQKFKQKQYSLGPYTQDIFGLLPLKLAGLTNGASYVEFGGTLQNQERVYFGPVNIHRMTIKLLNDKGDSVDLNGSNWSFSFVCEQLYQQSSI